MPKTQIIDREKFFTTVRDTVFGGTLKQGQVDGMNVIVDTWDASVFTDLRWLAYMLGTAYHETAATMQPIKEYGTHAYFELMYGPSGRRPAVARKMGNTEHGDGARYCGRGFVQLTWKNGYRRAGETVGRDLVADPDLAMQPDIAAQIMFEGMTRADIIFEDKTSIDAAFSFTGKTLEDYFNDTVEDWVNARRIINGTDHAVMIGETAKAFHAALRYRDIEVPDVKFEVSPLDQIKAIQVILNVPASGNFEKDGRIELESIILKVN